MAGATPARPLEARDRYVVQGDLDNRALGGDLERVPDSHRLRGIGDRRREPIDRTTQVQRAVQAARRVIEAAVVDLDLVATIDCRLRITGERRDADKHT